MVYGGTANAERSGGVLEWLECWSIGVLGVAASIDRALFDLQLEIADTIRQEGRTDAQHSITPHSITPLLLLFRINPDGNRSIVDQPDGHVRPEHSTLD
jgi:hypothetical protein